MTGLEKGKKKAVDLDTILEDEVGQFGKYQVLTLALAAFPVMFSAFAAGEYVFTTARVSSRCLIPECDAEAPEYAPPWILNAVPGSSVDDLANCERFVNSSVRQRTKTCPAELFDRNQTVKCDAYVYENTLSVVYDFDLACDEWRRSLIGTVHMTGTLLALPTTGFISDRWGRRVALAMNAFNTGWIGLARSFVNSYELFVILQILESTFGAGTYSSCYILITELVGPKYRVVAGTFVFTFVAMGHMSLGLIAWGIPSWRPLTQVLYAPQLFVLIYFWILSESVRWLMSNGRYEESEKILKKVAKRNNKELSQKSLEALREGAEYEKTVDKPKEPWLPILVFRSKVILSRCCVSPIWWITSTLVYYGMSINAVNLTGNRYLNYVAVAAVEIPGYWTAILLLDRVGRKPVLIAAYFICAACQFIFAFMPEDLDDVALAVYLVGKYCIAVVFTSVYVYTAELYPTKYRHSLFAFSSMIGRLGSIMAPLTPAFAKEVWGPLPSVLFGGLAALSGILVFTTPETLGSKLPDTMEEAEQLSYSRKI